MLFFCSFLLPELIQFSKFCLTNLLLILVIPGGSFDMLHEQILQFKFFDLYSGSLYFYFSFCLGRLYFISSFSYMPWRLFPLRAGLCKSRSMTHPTVYIVYNVQSLYPIPVLLHCSFSGIQ